MFDYYPTPQGYEQTIASSIAQHINACDYLLDLHSMHANGTPFVFQDYPDQETMAFAQSLGTHYIVSGRPEMYQDLTSSDTLSYAHEQGKIGAVIECGAHEDPASGEIAYTAIIRALQYL